MEKDNQSRIELIRENIKMQLIYDKLKKEHSVEMEKVVNCFANRETSTMGDFIPFEQIILYEDFLRIAGQEVADDLMRYFSNLDFSDYEEFVANLTLEELEWIDTFINLFRYPNAKNKENFNLSELLRSVISSYRNNEKWYFNIEGLHLERTKPCEN